MASAFLAPGACAQTPAEAKPKLADADSTDATTRPTVAGNASLDQRQARLFWSASFEDDIGYARYEAEEEAITDDTRFDHRGRFVLGPTLHLDLGNHYFVQAQGQLVAWVKNRVSNYVIDADDVWAKFGRDGLWEIQIGRFEAWRVYNKFPERDRDPRPQVVMNESTGAFDLFTLEDTGALCLPPVSNATYCTDMYEVNHILLREEVPSLALRLYPFEALKVELHGKWGESAQSNVIGGRVAAIYAPGEMVQLSAAYEARTGRPGSPQKLPDTADGTFDECSNCGRSDRRGFGGGVTVRFPPVELALNFARGSTDFYSPVDGRLIQDSSPEVTSYGGYAQVDVGPVTVGGAANQTERDDPARNHTTHLQTAGYVYWPFADNLSLKLVISYSAGTDDPFNRRMAGVEPPTNAYAGGRIRFKYLFNQL